MSKLTGEVIHGILLSLPEFIDMPEVLAYQVRDAAYFGNTLKLGGAECIKNFFFSNGNPVRAAYGPVGWPCG
ncbi:hypothetical protein [Enterobacter ludwigii]